MWEKEFAKILDDYGDVVYFTNTMCVSAVNKTIKGRLHQAIVVPACLVHNNERHLKSQL